MVSFRNGILKIEKSSDLNNSRRYRFLYEICLYIGLIGYYIMTYPILHYAGVAALIAGTLIITYENLRSFRINKSLFSLWYLGFIILCELSVLWAYSPTETAFLYLKMLIIILINGFGITQYVNSRADVERIFNIFLYVALTTALIQFICTPFSLWFNGYFGGYFGGINTNVFGYILMYASIIAFNKAYNHHKRIWYLAVVVFLTGCVLSSSRKATAISAFGIISVILLSYKRKHHIFHLFLAVLSAATVLMLLIENDFLYQIIGYRIKTLFNFIDGNYSNAKIDSLKLRTFYITFAKELFQRHPIHGNGFISFHSMLNDETGMGNAYAHNNYWEILADLGIIGIIAYYWIYAYMLYKLIVNFIKNGFNNAICLGFVMLVSEVILEWGVVSLYQFYCQLVIVLIYICVSQSDTQKKFYYSE